MFQPVLNVYLRMRINAIQHSSFIITKWVMSMVFTLKPDKIPRNRIIGWIKCSNFPFIHYINTMNYLFIILYAQHDTNFQKKCSIQIQVIFLVQSSKFFFQICLKSRIAVRKKNHIFKRITSRLLSRLASN